MARAERRTVRLYLGRSLSTPPEQGQPAPTMRQAKPQPGRSRQQEPRQRGSTARTGPASLRVLVARLGLPVPEPKLGTQSSAQRTGPRLHEALLAIWNGHSTASRQVLFFAARRCRGSAAKARLFQFGIKKNWCSFSIFRYSSGCGQATTAVRTEMHGISVPRPNAAVGSAAPCSPWVGQRPRPPLARYCVTKRAEA